MITFLAVAAATLAPLAQQPSVSVGELAFSVRTWEGEYFSRDIPGGVETSPVTSTIYTIRADGTGLREIVRQGKVADAPVYSSDKKWLYFQSTTDRRTHLFRCRADGTDVVQLTTADKLGKPWISAYGLSLSANGRRMCFTVYDGNTGRVALADVMDEGLGTPRILAGKLGYLYMAALSPAGDRVVCSGPAAGYRLHLIHLDTGMAPPLTANHPESFVPQFTPDGKTIVFFRRDGDIYSVSVDGGNPRRLTTGNRYGEFKLSSQDRHGSSDAPHISADGRRIAYIAVKEGVANVHTMNLDGTEQQQLTFRKAACGRVRWSPDGRQLAFVSFEGKTPQLFVIPAEGGEARRLTQVAGAVYFLTWK